MTVQADRIWNTTIGGLPHVYKHPSQTRPRVWLAFGETPNLHLPMTVFWCGLTAAGDSGLFRRPPGSQPAGIRPRIGPALRTTFRK